MATHRSIHAWRVPRTGEPGGLQSRRESQTWHGRPAWVRGLQYQEVATRWPPEDASPESQAQPPPCYSRRWGPHGSRFLGCGERGTQLLPPGFHRVKAGPADHPGPLEEGPGEGSFKLPRRVQRVQAEQGGGSLPPKRQAGPSLLAPRPSWPKLAGRREAGLGSRAAPGRLRAAGHRTEGPSSSGDTAPH